jgi:hypothetical protein
MHWSFIGGDTLVCLETGAMIRSAPDGKAFWIAPGNPTGQALDVSYAELVQKLRDLYVLV